MSKHIKELQAFLAELDERRDVYIQKAPTLIRKIYKNREKGPKVFNESSFLYIRSYAGDTGLRPFSGIAFWNSPDIDIIPLTSTVPISNNTIDAGETYVLRCRLHNSGDVMVPYPKVEFFLTTPSLGFDVRFATQLGATLMRGILLPHGNGWADLTYNVPITEGGHKCLFARTFSFSPLDKPYDLYSLDPTKDRHIGQKNLNIVPQASAYQFNLVHLPNANEKIEFVPLNMNEIIALGDPSLAKFKWKEKAEATAFKEAKIETPDKERRIGIKRSGRAGFEIFSEGEGLTLAKQAALVKSVNRALTQINAGKAKFSQHKELFQRHTQMNKPMMCTKLLLHIPNMGLKAGEAAAWNMVNTNIATGEIKGGITIVVKG